MEYLAGRFDLTRVPMGGASGGALCAALARCGVPAEAITESAYALSLAHRIWERPLGLVGVWGRIIEAWLEELLPADAAGRCAGGLGVVVCTLPSCRQVWIDDFADKPDLINCVMASAHVPMLLDLRLARPCRGAPCVDGSLPDFFLRGGANCDHLEVQRRGAHGAGWARGGLNASHPNPPPKTPPPSAPRSATATRWWWTTLTTPTSSATAASTCCSSRSTPPSSALSSSAPRTARASRTWASSHASTPRPTSSRPRRTELRGGGAARRPRGDVPGGRAAPRARRIARPPALRATRLRARPRRARTEGGRSGRQPETPGPRAPHPPHLLLPPLQPPSWILRRPGRPSDGAPAVCTVLMQPGSDA
jgi:hypothetical protein